MAGMAGVAGIAGIAGIAGMGIPSSIEFPNSPNSALLGLADATNHHEVGELREIIVSYSLY